MSDKCQNQQEESKVNQFQKQELDIQQKPKIKFLNQIPSELLNNEKLNLAIGVLPKHYNFEIHKSIWRIIEMKKQLSKERIAVCLQFPEGLMMFACLISDILQNYAECDCIILGDIPYGACCVDDLTTKYLGADFLIHYGHSCLVPINETQIQTLYVFVEITIEMNHFKQTVLINFPDKTQYIYLMGTVQFNSTLFQAKQMLNEEGYCNIFIPQEKPRSSGEVLGCTSPKLSVRDGTQNIMLFIADGRFHMEAAMIANPEFIAYQYNPYTKKITIEKYDNQLMMTQRLEQVKQCQIKLKMIGLIFGTLGRQGNQHLLNRMESVLSQKQIDYFVLLVSEIDFKQLALIADQVDFFVQIACPRLSIDWGCQFQKPLLNPYEFFVAIQQFEWQKEYPMDNYSNNGEIWTNYYHKKNPDAQKKEKIKLEFSNQ